MGDISGASAARSSSAATEIAASNEEMAAGLSNQQEQTELARRRSSSSTRRRQRHRPPVADASRAGRFSRSSAESGGKVVTRHRQRDQGIASEVEESASRRERAGQEERADRRDHQCDQRHRRADQPARAERRDRGGPGGRARARLRGRRRRGPQARRADDRGDRGGQPVDPRDPGGDHHRGRADRRTGSERMEKGVELAPAPARAPGHREQLQAAAGPGADDRRGRGGAVRRGEQIGDNITAGHRGEQRTTGRPAGSPRRRRNSAVRASGCRLS
jgi:hypothetical protein